MGTDNFGIMGALFMGLAIVSIIIVLFLVLREFFCWYWKINKHIEIQEELLENIKEILEELKKNNNS